MPETIIPPEEQTTGELISTVVSAAVAGQGVVRRIFLYAVAALLVVTPLAPLAVVPLVLLLATDHDVA